MGGEQLLKLYKKSPFLLLSAVYDKYEWLPWKFQSVPSGFWEEETNQRKFIEWAGKHFQVKEMSDWYKISTRVKNGGNFF